MAVLDTYLKLQDRVMTLAGLSGTSDRALVKDYINQAGYELYDVHEMWSERVSEAEITTVAPYVTGTADVTNGSTQVDGSGTTWTAAMAGRKFALDYGEPAFVIDSRTDNTTIDLDTSWPFASESSKSYVIYQDVYSLASDCDKILGDQVMFYDSEGFLMREKSPGGALEEWMLPRSTGKPDRFFEIEKDSSGYRQIRVGPQVPDDVYVLRYRYLKAWTEMSDDADVPVIPAKRRDLLVSGALKRVYMLPRFRDSNLAVKEEANWARLLGVAKRADGGVSGTHISLEAFDGRAGRSRARGLPWSYDPS